MRASHLASSQERSGGCANYPQARYYEYIPQVWKGREVSKLDRSAGSLACYAGATWMWTSDALNLEERPSCREGAGGTQEAGCIALPSRYEQRCGDWKKRMHG